MNDALRADVRAVIDQLSSDELLAVHEYLEQILEKRGIDPYVHLDAGDELDDEDRKRLHASIERGLGEMRRGQGRPAEDFLAELRRRR